MSAPISHELVTNDRGDQFIISGNPDQGYTLRRVARTVTIDTYKRKWQAKQFIADSESDS